MSGTLRLAHERVQAAVYFEHGEIVYAAANLKSLRLREYLIKRGTEAAKIGALMQGDMPDLELAAKLVANQTLRQKEVDGLLELLVSDVLRVGLLWTAGNWEFTDRARLSDPVRVKVEAATLLREASQRMPIMFVWQRFRNPAETIARAHDVPAMSSLLPSESFVLSRLDQPMRLDELVPLSGLPEPDARRVIYGLTLSGLLTREYWQNAFRTESAKPAKEQPAVQAAANAATAEPKQTNWSSASVEDNDLEDFLERLRKATSHYEVMQVEDKAKASEIKDAYYAMARRYHPDRFHEKSGSKLHSDLSSAFARVTQAYEILMNANTRAAYDHNLQRTRQIAAVKAAETAQTGQEPAGYAGAEDSFREGFGALEQGRITDAIAHLAQASRLEPQDARYRAYYGRALAASESARRLAENEIQAAIKLEPSNAVYRTMLAELYFELKFHRRAQTELDRALAIDPKNVVAQSLLRKLQKSRKVG